METKFGILDKVVYFNTAECKIATDEVKRIQVMPTGISKDEKGGNVLDGYVVLYEMMEGVVLSEKECFASEEECRARYREFFN